MVIYVNCFVWVVFLLHSTLLSSVSDSSFCCKPIKSTIFVSIGMLMSIGIVLSGGSYFVECSVSLLHFSILLTVILEWKFINLKSACITSSGSFCCLLPNSHIVSIESTNVSRSIFSYLTSFSIFSYIDLYTFFLSISSHIFLCFFSISCVLLYVFFNLISLITYLLLKSSSAFSILLFIILISFICFFISSSVCPVL